MPAYRKEFESAETTAVVAFLKLCILEDKLRRAMPLATLL